MLDLQPDFQRGQVWSEGKKQRLVDTILRQWYVPAIHIVLREELDAEEVLDGQQRLRAIMDFEADSFSIDGRIEPEDETIRSLHGFTFSQLPNRIQFRFRKFPIGTVRLRQYRPEEPGELFFRLNQLTALTAAEQRNALFGKPRNQIRALSQSFQRSLDKASIGFSNARMNFDDTISRLAVTLELGSLQEKVTAARLEQRYRTGKEFAGPIVDSIERALNTVAKLARHQEVSARLNKASLFSRVYFFVEYEFGVAEQLHEVFADFFQLFEAARSSTRFPSRRDTLSRLPSNRVQRAAFEQALAIFNDRSSSRVNDVNSVILRDLSLTCSLLLLFPDSTQHSRRLKLRESTARYAVEKLSNMPPEVAEKSLIESQLASRWEDRRAAS